MTIAIEKYLKGGDLRSIGKVGELLPHINYQKDFDLLFNYLYSEDRLIRMKAADAIEKVTKVNASYLESHKNGVLQLLYGAKEKGLKWHLALLACRIPITKDELQKVWELLSIWTKDKHESKIVRVNALPALLEFSLQNQRFDKEFEKILLQLEKE